MREEDCDAKRRPLTPEELLVYEESNASEMFSQRMDITMQGKERGKEEKVTIGGKWVWVQVGGGFKMSRFWVSVMEHYCCHDTF